MKNLILSLIVIYSIIFTTACPARLSIANAKASSAKVAAFADEGVNITRELFRAKVLSPAQARVITEKFITLARAGIAFDLMVKKLESESGANPAKPEIEKLFRVFSSDVVVAFADVMKSLKLSGDLSQFAGVVGLIQTAILTIARAFRKEGDISRALEAAA